MHVLYFLLVAIAFIILLLFAVDAKVRLLFDTDNDNMYLSVCWLYPFIKASGRMENSSPFLDISLFGMRIYSKKLTLGKSKKAKIFKKTDLLRILKLKGLDIDTRYGFVHPSTTGITCGAVNSALQFINIDSFNNIPDFMSAHDYIYLDAKASVNLGASLINLIKYYKNRRNLKWIRTQA